MGTRSFSLCPREYLKCLVLPFVCTLFFDGRTRRGVTPIVIFSFVFWHTSLLFQHTLDLSGRSLVSFSRTFFSSTIYTTRWFEASFDRGRPFLVVSASDPGLWVFVGLRVDRLGCHSPFDSRMKLVWLVLDVPLERFRSVRMSHSQRLREQKRKKGNSSFPSRNSTV